ncbi:P-loop containing nucleoside triphosphate hydrolase protein [Apiospora arundinis]
MDDDQFDLPRIAEVLDASQGSVCEVRHYESLFNTKGERVLLASGARQSQRPTARDSASIRSALILTKVWDRDKEDCHTELEIQSPHMKEALKACVPQYEDHNIEHKNIILRDEPRCVFHYKEELILYRQRCMSENRVEAGRHIQYLIDHMAGSLITEMYLFPGLASDSDQPPELDFNNLWMAFVPGDLICIDSHVLKTSEPRKVYRFERMERCYCPNPLLCSRSPWRIVAYSISCNGDRFGYIMHELIIEPYEGFRSLATLPIMPLKYHPNRESIRSELIERGASTELFPPAAIIWVMLELPRLFGPNHPIGATSNTESLGTKHMLMVDCKAALEYWPDGSPLFASDKRTYKAESNAHMELTNDDLIICEAEIIAYSLGTMKWGLFQVDCIVDVAYDEEAFASLLLDQDHKDTVLSLVRIHSDERAMVDDVITGKGKGMVMLLHGPPGVGKSLTAESVAEHTRKPLMRLQTSTLGDSPAEVEDGLSDAFTLAVKWDAVALLDGADVFLEQRDSVNLERNRLVSIFLRVLEFYQGILILTSNRVAAFDTAIMSRVHIVIHYPNLDRQSQRKLWSLFLSRLPNDSGKSVTDENDLGILDEYDLDGREIKNIVRTAHSLAVSESSPSVGLNHLQKALKTRHLQPNMAVPGFKDQSGNQTRGVKRRRLIDEEDE